MRCHATCAVTHRSESRDLTALSGGSGTTVSGYELEILVARRQSLNGLFLVCLVGITQVCMLTYADQPSTPCPASENQTFVKPTLFCAERVHCTSIYVKSMHVDLQLF